MMTAMDAMHVSKPPRMGVNLFCLPFSGGNIYSYRALAPCLAEFITLRPIELPGHGIRLKAPLLTNLPAMVTDAWQQIQARLPPPYAIYGHSLGALLGYLLCRRIIEEQRPRPLHLFVSGHQGPFVPNKMEKLHLLPTAEFIAKVQAYGGLPDVVAGDQDLMALFIPILRADFQAIAEHGYEKEAPLDIPITVMIGAEEHVTRDDALAWQAATTHEIAFAQFPGNHFFIFQHFPEIGKLISEMLTQKA